MAINTYKFSYELSHYSAMSNLTDDYLYKAKNYIKEITDNPSFEFPKYFRCSVVYTPIIEINEEMDVFWYLHYKKMIDGQGLIELDKFKASTYERYIYNNKEIPLEYAETQISDKFGLEEFHSIEYQFGCLWKDKHTEEYINMLGRKYQCSVIVTYSDDDPSAGDRYVEPEPRKKIYLANLDFGYRRSRRNNKNRRKYRNYRNRY